MGRFFFFPHIKMPRTSAAQDARHYCGVSFAPGLPGVRPLHSMFYALWNFLHPKGHSELLFLITA